MLFCYVFCCIVLFCIVLYCVVLYLFYCIVLYCFVLYCVKFKQNDNWTALVGHDSIIFEWSPNSKGLMTL